MATFANVVAIFFIAHFCWSYYWNCYKKGYTLDVWHFALLMNLFVIHIMLPFSRSNLNVLSIGYALKRTQAHVDEAYLISALGYLAILIGGNLWRVDLGFGIRRTFDRFVELPTRAAYFLLNSKTLLILHGGLGLALMASILLFYFASAGFGFNLRGLLLVTPALRPIAQFSVFYCGLIGSYCVARFYQYRERSMLLIPVLMAVGFIFYGERGNIFGMVGLLLPVLFIRLGRRLKLYWIALAVGPVLFLVFWLDALRQGNLSPISVVNKLVINVLFGNSFSDTRDFATVLSYWKGDFLFGLSYVAGLFAFVPRFFSSFRETWAMGVVTAKMAGFSPKEHPGLRVGIFGESYLNFGLPGVVLVGLITGAVTRLIDSRMKQAAKLLPPSDMRIFSYSLAGMIVSFSQNSVSGSSIYTVLLILFLAWLSGKLLSFLKLMPEELRFDATRVGQGLRR